VECHIGGNPLIPSRSPLIPSRLFTKNLWSENSLWCHHFRALTKCLLDGTPTTELLPFIATWIVDALYVFQNLTMSRSSIGSYDLLKCSKFLYSAPSEMQEELISVKTQAEKTMFWVINLLILFANY